MNLFLVVAGAVVFFILLKLVVEAYRASIPEQKK